MKTILIVDDHESTTEAIQKIVEARNDRALIAHSAEQAFEIYKSTAVDLIITDMKLPGQSGLELLKRVREIDADIPVLVITAFGTVQNAVEAIKLGAFDYVLKPFSVEEIEFKMRKAFEAQEPAPLHQRLRLEDEASATRTPARYAEIIGQSRKMQELFVVLDKAAAAPSPVLILGESGTGKELIARALHYNSPRASQPFIKVNCAALAEGVLESELFGHDKGAFTGAIKTKPGRFELAAQGTIFLDEIGEISPAVQVKLLRVLQEKEFERVGGTTTLKMQARLIAATNQDLVKFIAANKFREDLYYRLNVVTIDLPSLRERLEDIPALVRHFINKSRQTSGKNIQDISPHAMKCLMNYTWPGNIRELENVIERASVLSSDAMIDVEDLTPNIVNAAAYFLKIFDANAAENDHYTKRMEEFEKQLIFNALLETHGNISRAADLLGLKRTTLRYKLEKHDLLRFKFE